MSISCPIATAPSSVLWKCMVLRATEPYKVPLCVQNGTFLFYMRLGMVEEKIYV